VADLGRAKLAVVDDKAASLIKPAPTRRGVITGNTRGIETYNSHPAFGLTAEMLVSYFRQAERGRPVRQFDTFDDLIETDGHLRGLINGRVESVSGCDWVLKPGAPDAASTIAAAALEERLRNHLGFREFIEHHLMAVHLGIACTNLVWDVEERVIAPMLFTNAAARRFASPSQDRADEIWLVDGDSSNLIELEYGLWAISRYRHRNPWAAGLMRTCAWWALFKRWGVRDWQVFADMFGLPLVVGYYEEGASEESRKALEDAVKNVGTDGYAVLSAMTEIVIKDTVRSGDSSTVYPQICKLAEAQMSKLIAGATLTTDAGSGPGSYALGNVHEEREAKLARADARRIEEMFVRDIGIPFKVWNGFDRAAPPRLKIQITRDNLERAQVLQVVGQVVELDEAQIREEFSLREPAPGKGVKFPTKVAPDKPPIGGK
jgi:phage gp29-like protein